jgi:Secretion system C-terminal sorting domain
MKRFSLAVLFVLAALCTVTAQDGQLRYAKAGRYTSVPDGQQSAITFTGTIRNITGITLNNATLNVIVLAQGNPVPVYNQTSNTTNVPGNDSVNVTLATTWTPPSGPQNYEIVFDITSPNDLNAANDGVTRPFRVDPNDYRCDDGSNVNGIGIVGGNIRQGQVFQVNAAEDLAQVQVYTTGGNVGDTLNIEVWSMAGNVPNAVLFSSAPITITNNASAWRVFTLPSPYPLSVGSYLVVMRHGVSTDNIGMGITNYNYTPGNAFLRIGNNAWGNLENSNFLGAYQIRIRLGTLPAQDIEYDGRPFMTNEFLNIPLYELTDPLVLGARVVNTGTASISNVSLTAKVFQLPNTTSPIFTGTSNVLTSLIAPGNTASLTTTTGWVPTANGQYQIQYRFGAPGEPDSTDNLGTLTMTIGPTAYARDNGDVTGSLGIDDAPGTVGLLGQNFRFEQTSTIDSIRFYWQNPIAGNLTRVVVLNTVQGNIAGTPVRVPSTQIDSSAVITASATPGWYTVQLLAPLTVTGGSTIFVGLKEQSANILGLGTTSDLYSPYGMWVAWTGQAWAPLANFSTNLQRAFAVRVYATNTCTTAIATVSESDVPCFGDQLGSISLNFSVDTTGWVYNWSNGVTTQDVTGLDTGTFTVNVLTALGCTTTVGPFVITQPEQLVATATGTNPTSSSSADGSVSVTSTGGNGGGTIVWALLGGGTVGTTATLSNLGAGTYTATVLDSAGCQDTAVVVLTTPTSLNDQLHSQVSLYPNPTRGSLTVENTAAQAVAVSIFSLTGQLVLQLGNVAQGLRIVDVSALPAGAYTVQLRTATASSSQLLVRQ